MQTNSEPNKNVVGLIFGPMILFGIAFVISNLLDPLSLPLILHILLTATYTFSVFLIISFIRWKNYYKTNPDSNGNFLHHEICLLEVKRVFLFSIVFLITSCVYYLFDLY